MENFVFPDEIKTKMMKIDETWNGGRKKFKKNSKRSKFGVKSHLAGKFPHKVALNMYIKLWLQTN